MERDRLTARVAPIYVTGHRNPDTDSIAAAVGYAELKRRLDPSNEYGDGIGRNFHRWRGKDYGTAYPRGSGDEAGQVPAEAVMPSPPGVSAH